MQKSLLKEKYVLSNESRTESLKDARNGSRNAGRKRFAEKRKKRKPDDKVSIIKILFVLIFHFRRN